MIDCYATQPETPMSLPIRMEQRRKRTRASAAALVASVVTLGGAGYNFTVSGSELIAVYLAVVGLGLFGLGLSLRAKAKKMR